MVRRWNVLSTTWQTLNGLRKPEGKLVYNSYRNRYDLFPDRRTVGTGVVTDLLERGYVERIPDAPAAVYGITEAGREAWRRTPEGVHFSGQCDNCEIVTKVQPKRIGIECLYLCDRCIAQLMEEGADGVETTPAPQKL